MSNEIETLAKELRNMLTASGGTLLSKVSPTLGAHVVEDGDEQPTVLDAQYLLDEAIQQISHTQGKAAADRLLGSGPLRFEPLKIRGHEAAIAWGGVSYDAFRRSGSGAMHYVLQLIAAELRETMAQVSPPTPTSTWDVGKPAEQGVAPANETTPARPTWSLVMAVLTVVVIGAIAIRPLVWPPDELSDQAGSARLTESDVPECLAPGEGDVGEISDMIEESVEKLAVEGLCGYQPSAWLGQVVFQELRLRGQIWGGVLAWRQDEQVEVRILELGPWQSYLRIGGGSGIRSPILGGLPEGQPVEINGRWQIPLSGAAEMYGEAADGTFYWMPAAAAEKWRDEGGSESWLGWPTSSPYWRQGQLTVDFEGGSVYQASDGTLQTRPPGVDPETELGQITEILNSVITAADGTSWIVDSSGGRWWISSGLAWHCANAEEQRSRQDLSGTAVHMLPYRGHVRCPARVPGFATTGSLDIQLYCEDQFERNALMVEDPEPGWQCGRSNPPLMVQDLCEWQYGETASAIWTPGDRHSWRCEQRL